MYPFIFLKSASKLLWPVSIFHPHDPDFLVQRFFYQRWPNSQNYVGQISTANIEPMVKIMLGQLLLPTVMSLLDWRSCAIWDTVLLCLTIGGGGGGVIMQGSHIPYFRFLGPLFPDSRFLGPLFPDSRFQTYSLRSHIFPINYYLTFPYNIKNRLMHMCPQPYITLWLNTTWYRNVAAVSRISRE